MFNALILAVLIKVNIECNNPWVATGLFVGLSFILRLMFGDDFLVIIMGATINIGLGFLYFWSLKKTEDSGVWWGVVILGICVFTGIGFL